MSAGGGPVGGPGGEADGGAPVPRLRPGDEAPAPVAARRPLAREAHGERWTDDYAWLRADDWQAAVRDPARLPGDIRHHLEAENAHADAVLAGTEALQRRLVEELRGRIEPHEESLPEDDGPWTYLERFAEGDEYAVQLRRPRAGGEARVILDPNVESEGAACFDVGDAVPSPDHRHLAWTVDEDGAELYTLLIRDLDTLEDVEEIEEVGDVAWASAQVLFYTRLDEELRASRVYRHVLGTDPADDALVHEERDPRFECSVATTRSRAWVLIGCDTGDTSEVRLVPTATPFAEPVVLEPRTPGLEYAVEHQGERFLILSNADGATDFAILEAPCATPGRSHWTPLVPHVPGRILLDVHACGEHVVWIERENALPRVRWMDARGQVRSFEVDEAAYSLSLEPLVESDAARVRIGHSSPTTPERVHELDLASGERTLLKTQRVPSGHDPARYRAERVHAVSADGSEVPVTLLRLADTPLDGTAPCLLHVYGAYGSSLPADFDTDRLPLVERGFVHAVAHVRGGQEKGRAWYEASRFGGRERVVEDLLAVGETLVRTGVCAPGRIVLHGASAGGLAVGAALNRAPPGYPWGGAILDVPFVDPLNTMLDATLPLTPGEWSEWGNPIEDAAAFADIRRHSPYDNVARRDYPPLLVTAGIVDSRVLWWEPAKWVARVRARRTNAAPLAFRTNLHAGHFGESGRYAGLADEARALAFAIAAVG